MRKHEKPFSYFDSMGYQVIGVKSDGAVVCWSCIPLDSAGECNANECMIKGYAEGPTIQCDECGAEIESDYGDPEEA